jgi:hypothetical protein
VKPVSAKTVIGGVLVSALALASLSLPKQTHGFTQVQLEAIDQSWYELSPQERSRALENYRRFQKLPPEKQRSLEEQYNRWQGLPSDEKERLRRNYQRYRGMNSDEKEEFSRKYRQWRSQGR